MHSEMVFIHFCLSSSVSVLNISFCELSLSCKVNIFSFFLKRIVSKLG